MTVKNGNYKKVLDDLRISMSKLYEKYEIGGQISWSEVSKYNRLQKIDELVKLKVMNLYSTNSKMIRGTLQGIIKDTYTNTILIVDGVVEPKLKGIIKDLPVADIINDDMAGLNWTSRVGKHRSDLIYDIQKEIKQGLSQGDTYSTMTARLKKKLGEDTARINTIVRTEAHRVKGQAKEESFNKIEKGGVKFKEQWLSAADERVRSAHAELNGTVIERGEMFHSPTGAVGKGPGLMNNAADDIHCRCIKILLLED